MDSLTGISLFSGAGGLDLAAKWAGIRTVCYVERDPYAQGVLMSRMRDGTLDDAPIFEDVRTFRGTSLRGSIDVVSGGFPCQDLSVAGKRAGIQKGSRSGLWREFARILGEIRPQFALVENVSGLLLNGALGVVLGDLAELGFDAQWEMLSASAVGAPHRRQRVFLVAYAGGNGHERVLLAGGLRRKAEALKAEESKVRERMRPTDSDLFEVVAYSECERLQGGILKLSEPGSELPIKECGCGRRHRVWPSWGSEPCVDRVDDGVAYLDDRTRLTGNGVVPQQALPAFQRIVTLARGKDD